MIDRKGNYSRRNVFIRIHEGRISDYDYCGCRFSQVEMAGSAVVVLLLSSWTRKEE